VLNLPSRLGIPLDIIVHDYAWLCPRITLIGPSNRFCGEPALHACEACLADTGSRIEEEIGSAALRTRSAAQLAAARRVVVPSADAARRLRHHFPDLRPIVEPWEDDAALPSPQPARRDAVTKIRVCIAGAIGIEKGYELLLACARDAAQRHLALEFVVAGYTMDDRRLWDTGTATITGPYAPDEAVALIRAQHADLGFLPSLWPETWCYALSEMWQAGLDVAVLDIGAPADRVRTTGRGWILPLGLSPAAINNALLAAPATRAAWLHTRIPADLPARGRSFAAAEAG
jgi:glycosyltransferase involved in cell wall biosynthesis